MTNRTRRFPVRVENEFARRHGQMVAGSIGDVLDLDDPGARAILLAAMGDPEAKARFDAVVSVGQLIRFPDLSSAIRGMERLLRPGGTAFIVETIDPPDLLATIATSIWSRARPVRGFHMGRDVAAVVRSGGFLIDTIERFSIPTLIYPLRHAVSIRAVRRGMRDVSRSVAGENGKDESTSRPTEATR
jgi:SAM-dependent methyltransferase